VTETSLYRRLGLLRGELADFPRRHVEAEYFRVLVFEDEVEVRLWVDQVGTASVTYRWEISKDGERAIEGKHTVVRVGPDGRTRALDDHVRTLLEG
jgi:acyl-CoA thioesterase FadM